MSDDDGEERQGSRNRDAPRRLPPAKIARRACAEFEQLSGRDVETVVSLSRVDDGWCLGIEVLEIKRIPDTADVLAEYEVTADRSGHLLGYERRRRYTRATTREDR